jgi:hypothetical protein
VAMGRFGMGIARADIIGAGVSLTGVGVELRGTCGTRPLRREARVPLGRGAMVGVVRTGGGLMGKVEGLGRSGSESRKGSMESELEWLLAAVLEWGCGDLCKIV